MDKFLGKPVMIVGEGSKVLAEGTFLGLEGRWVAILRRDEPVFINLDKVVAIKFSKSQPPEATMSMSAESSGRLPDIMDYVNAGPSSARKPDEEAEDVNPLSYLASGDKIRIGGIIKPSAKDMAKFEAEERERARKEAEEQSE